MKYLPILILFIATNIHAEEFRHSWGDPNTPILYPSQLEIQGDGMPAFWIAATTMEVRAYPATGVSIPDEWDCHLTRARFVGGDGYSEYSNVIATPEGCIPIEYVPEPGGLAMLTAGIGVLWWMRGKR